MLRIARKLSAAATLAGLVFVAWTDASKAQSCTSFTHIVNLSAAAGKMASNASMDAMYGNYSSACRTGKRALSLYEEIYACSKSLGDSFHTAQVQGHYESQMDRTAGYCDKVSIPD